jgi:hypothetical protein
MMSKISGAAALAGIVSLLGLALPAAGQLAPDDPASYFAAMPLHESATPIRMLLDEIHETCTKIDQACPAGAEILESLFRGAYRDDLPDFIVDLRRDEEGGRLRARQPVLIFDRRNTPYLFGVEAVWVLVVSEAEVPIEARLTTIRHKEVNPFTGMMGVVGVSAGEAVESAESSIERNTLRWRRLNSSPDEEPLFIGSARLPIETGVVARITLIPEDYDAVAFQSITAHLSNSRSSAAAFAGALGITLDTKDTLLESEGDPAFNGYVFAKFFLPGRRPRLEVSPNRRSVYRPSIALLVGTNLTNDAFQEIVAGVSFGHLVGKSGLVVAGNWVRSFEAMSDESGERRWKLLIGVDFTF